MAYTEMLYSRSRISFDDEEHIISNRIILNVECFEVNNTGELIAI